MSELDRRRLECQPRIVGLDTNFTNWRGLRAGIKIWIWIGTKIRIWIWIKIWIKNEDEEENEEEDDF